MDIWISKKGDLFEDNFVLGQKTWNNLCVMIDAKKHGTAPVSLPIKMMV